MKFNSKFFSFSSNRNGTLISIFGCHIAFNVFGNCFSPAICFETGRIINSRGAANPISRFAIVLRTRNFDETSFHFYTDFNFHWAFNWNSEHLARHFGTFHETDFGGYHQWNRFGHHVRL